ncbi:MAG: hypothetical protein R3E79_08885 [Caldilineaceae bacterium]
MSTYGLPKLLTLWVRGELTAEQVAGHILQNLLHLDERVSQLERRLRELEQQIPSQK